MLNWISNWTQSIIVAVIVGTIIEMILPEGNSKKYIKVVVGVYVLFSIVSPVITKFTNKQINVSNIIDVDMYIAEMEESEKMQNNLESSNENNIKEIYISTLKNDIKSKVEGKDYKVKAVSIAVEDDENFTLNSITLTVQKSEEKEDPEEVTENKTANIETVKEINISISNSEETNNLKEQNEKESQLSNSEKSKLKDYLSSVYEISVKNININ